MTQETVANHPCQSASAPVAMPRRYDLARCLCRHAEIRGQYITRAHRLGTLMRHFFLPPARPIASLAPGMGAAPLVGALVPPACLALPNASCLIPARFAAIALAPVTVRAHQDHAVAMHARQRPSAPQLPTKHWHSPWSPECPQRRASERWTRSNAGAIICTHPWLTRWGAPADNNLPVVAAVAPVLLNNSAVLPLVRPHANSPAKLPWLSCLNSILNGCLASASASGRRLQPGERWASHEPDRAVHRLVLWAGGLSTAGECPQPLAQSTVTLVGGSIRMSGGGSVSVSAKERGV